MGVARSHSQGRCVEVSGAEEKISGSSVKSQSLEGSLSSFIATVKDPWPRGRWWAYSVNGDRLWAVEERVQDIFPGTDSCCDWAPDGPGYPETLWHARTLMEPANQLAVLCHCMRPSTAKQAMTMSQPWLLGQGLLVPKV